MLESMTDNCREIKKVARFKGTLVFTDVGGRQVKWYNPSTKNVETVAADGSEGAQDGTKKSCSFVQVHGICSVSDASRQLQISTRWRSTRAIRMTVTMMSILSQKNWLLVSQ